MNELYYIRIEWLRLLCFLINNYYLAILISTLLQTAVVKQSLPLSQVLFNNLGRQTDRQRARKNFFM